MKANKSGFFDEETVKGSRLPYYSFEDPYDRYVPMDYWTFTDLKKVLNIKLTKQERETMIVAFQRLSKQQKGYSALYSFQEVVNKRYDKNVKFFPIE